MRGILIHAHSAEFLDKLDMCLSGKRHRTSCFSGTKLSRAIGSWLTEHTNIFSEAKGHLLSAIVEQHESEIVVPALNSGYIILHKIEYRDGLGWNISPDIIVDGSLVYINPKSLAIGTELMRHVLYSIEHIINSETSS